MPHPFDPIFVLDSGLGGLTVVDALRRRLPGERIIYFGDTARLPYGSKTRQTVGGFVKQIIEWGLQFNPKHVVIACNTASALALEETQARFPHLTISGVIEPGAAAAARVVSHIVSPSVGVIATEATVRSEAYQTALHHHSPSADVLAKATPLLVPLIEEGRRPSSAVVTLALRQYLRPMIRRKIDALVLGCTHYPLLRPALRRVLGEGVTVIDSAEQCAQDVAARLEAAGLLTTAERPAANESMGERLRLFVTDDPDRFGELAPRFLGHPVERPQRVAPETLYDPATPPALRRPA
ncbi:MAG: glutamate racemase [Phycisphaerales bacterium]|nr:glutamate racemase [Phycisphaerales bacterium]